jgi:heme-degrading monooxygenase HmoA
MFSVIFEVHPRPEKFDLYLDLAKDLRPILEAIDGFIDNERFESSRRPGWILSHSTWRDEKSVVRWRTVAKHHDTQQRGRDEVFQDLRVGEIVADTAPPAGAPILEQRLDETEIGRARYVTLTEVQAPVGRQRRGIAGLPGARSGACRPHRPRCFRQHLQQGKIRSAGVVA